MHKCLEKKESKVTVRQDTKAREKSSEYMMEVQAL